MTSHIEHTTTFTRFCNTKLAQSKQSNCDYSTKAGADSGPTTSVFIVHLKDTHPVTIQVASHTKQVGSVPAFGNGAGAATVISSNPPQEPKPTPISKPNMKQDTTMRTKQVGSVPAFGDGPGAATITSSNPLAEPEPTAITKPMEERDAWVQNVTPMELVPLTTLKSVAQVQPRERDITTLHYRDVTIQSAPPSQAISEITTRDTSVTAAEATVRVSPRPQYNGTGTNEYTHCKNGTEHRTHYHFNHTKTITEEIIVEEITTTKEIAVTTFPQFRTHNSSRTGTLPGSAPTLDSHYTQLTYHNADVAHPTQSAVFDSFQPAISGISHAPVSSQASRTSRELGLLQLCIFFYILFAGIVLITYVGQSIYDYLTGHQNPEDELLTEEQARWALANLEACAADKSHAKDLFEDLMMLAFFHNIREAKVVLAELKDIPFTKEDVADMKRLIRAYTDAETYSKTPADDVEEAADNDWEESEKLAAESSAQMWEATKKRRAEAEDTNEVVKRRRLVHKSSEEIENGEYRAVKTSDLD